MKKIKTDTKPRLSSEDNLRQKAEELLNASTNQPSNLSETELLSLIQELEIHRIELKLQTEELITAKQHADVIALKYAELYDFAPTGYFTLSGVGEIIDLNLCGSLMLGKERKRLKNSRFGFFVSDDSKSAFNLFLEKIFCSNDKATCEIILETKGNLPVYLHLTGITVENGVQCLVNAVDITERKKAELRVAKSEERFRFIAERSNDLIFVYTLIPKMGFEYVSPSAEKITGYTPEEHYNDPLLGMKLVHPDDRHVLKTLQNGIINQDITIIRWIRKDGSIIWTESQNIPILNEKGELTAIQGKATDITERIMAEERLKKLSQAVEQSPVSIVITDLDGKIEYANPEACENTGYPLNELIGNNPRVLKSGEFSSDEYKKLWETISGGNKWSGEFHNKKKNGELYWESATISPITGTDGKITHYLAVKEDITQRKQSEQEIHRLNANLELKIAARTAQLGETNQRLSDIIKGTNVGTWEWNIQTGETIFNERWAGIIGYTLEELSPVNIETWMKFAHPADLKLSDELLEKHFHRETDFYEVESRMKHKNGEWVWVFDRGRVSQWDADGKPLLMSGTHQDITDRKKAENFEKELLQLSLQLTGIPVTEIENALDLALGRIGSFLGADRTYIFEINTITGTMSNINEWCNEGVDPEIGNLQDIPYDIFPKWMATLNRNENVIIPSVRALPDTWIAEREILEPQGIQSLISIPMFLENNLIGFVGLDSVKSERVFSIYEINVLKVWGNMLASLINHRRKEEYIEQTRQNYETFFNTIDDFLLVIDENGKIIHTNKTVKQRLEYTLGELLGESILIVHPAEHREEAGRFLGEMLVGSADYCTIPLTTKSGTLIPVETRVRHGFWDGKPVFFSVSKDVSKIKLSEEKFSKAFQSNAALMAITGFEDGLFIDVNETLIKTLGYTRDELIGKTSLALNLFENHECRNTIMEKISQNIHIREVEVVAKTKTGVHIIGLFSADIIHIGNDKCLLTMMVDITERKRAEGEILKAKNEADKANKAKSEFLSRMSHELRTPMNSILGFGQLLQLGELNPAQHKNVFHILNSGKHLLNLINEVLDISRIESGHLLLTQESVHVKRIVNEMMETVRPMADEKMITLELLDSPTNYFSIDADKQRLKQVLLNLLSNAIKYNIKDGFVIIKTETMPLNDVGIFPLRISITDTGVGIPKEDIYKLFNPFERIGAERTTTEGTGLGLTVAKKLMIAMGGNIGVDSMPGMGSNFWIELPLSEGTNNNIETSNGIKESVSKKEEKSSTILYIEDSTSNVELVEQILIHRRSDIRLITNMSGKKAIQLAIELAPDLILLDLDLPDIPGSEVLRILKSDEKTRAIPVVIITADAMREQYDKLLEAGAEKYLTKPLDILAFLQVVDQWVIKKQIP